MVFLQFLVLAHATFVAHFDSVEYVMQLALLTDLCELIPTLFHSRQLYINF